MAKDIFLEALRTLSLEEKQELFDLLDKHPKLFSYLQKNFEQKLKLVENADMGKAREILLQEKIEANKVLKRLMQEHT